MVSVRSAVQVGGSSCFGHSTSMASSRQLLAGDVLMRRRQALVVSAFAMSMAVGIRVQRPNVVPTHVEYRRLSVRTSFIRSAGGKTWP